MKERANRVRPRRTRAAIKKQEAFAFPNGWGGVRKGAGPKSRGVRPCVSHRTRDGLERRLPAQVTMRVERGLPSLRGLKEFAVLRGAMVAGCERRGFRLVHFSVQSNHLHLIVEGDCRTSLSRGMQGLAVRMARALNRLWRRIGSVFADRFHDRILRSPSEVWNALRYVLCNARKHGAWTSRSRPDPMSSAPWFDGWREGLLERPESSPTPRGRTWLLNDGWSRFGLISIAAAPSPGLAAPLMWRRA